MEGDFIIRNKEMTRLSNAFKSKFAHDLGFLLGYLEEAHGEGYPLDLLHHGKTMVKRVKTVKVDGGDSGTNEDRVRG